MCAHAVPAHMMTDFCASAPVVACAAAAAAETGAPDEACPLACVQMLSACPRQPSAAFGNMYFLDCSHNFIFKYNAGFQFCKTRFDRYILKW